MTSAPEQSVLSRLIATQKVWRGKRSHVKHAAIDTGFNALNQKIHYGGWPTSGMIELYSEQRGIGELQLLMPALKHLQASQQPMIMINPPFQLNAVALKLAGINEQNIVVATPKKSAHTLWALEQSVKATNSTAVVAWLNHNLKLNQLRKLQLASEHGQCPLFIYRPTALLSQPSVAKLRLRLVSRQHTLLVNIVKQQGGRAGQTVALTYPNFSHQQPFVNTNSVPNTSTTRAALAQNVSTSTSVPSITPFNA